MIFWPCFRLLLSACSQPCFCSNRSCFAAHLTTSEDGADVSPERQQQGELDQEEGGGERSDGFRDSDDSEPDDASEGKGASEDDEEDDEEDNDRSDDDDYKGYSKGIDVFLVM